MNQAVLTRSNGSAGGGENIVARFADIAQCELGIGSVRSQSRECFYSGSRAKREEKEENKKEDSGTKVAIGWICLSSPATFRDFQAALFPSVYPRQPSKKNDGGVATILRSRPSKCNLVRRTRLAVERFPPFR